MKYVMVNGARRERPVIDDGAERQSILDDCRKAALAFINDEEARARVSAHGNAALVSNFGKLELARWLVGPYAEATRHCIHGERFLGISAATELLPQSIAELVARVRAELLDSLAEASRSGILPIADDAIERGLVIEGVDGEGDDLWLPVDGPRMGLLDRVVSLFVADYLNEPAAYDTLAVCGRCDFVSFDEVDHRHGVCVLHRRVSRIVPRDVDASDQRFASGIERLDGEELTDDDIAEVIEVGAGGRLRLPD